MRIKWFSMVRVTGLLLVLLYHFFQKLFPGGFLGVDIFFTFSGFLITALLIDEFSQSKKNRASSLLSTAFLSDCSPCHRHGIGGHALYLFDSAGFCSRYWNADCSSHGICD